MGGKGKKKRERGGGVIVVPSVWRGDTERFLDRLYVTEGPDAPEEET